MKHIIERLRDTDGSITPYNPIAKCFWVEVDKERRIPLFCETEAGIDNAIAQLHLQLEEEDRRKEEEEKERPKTYSKLRLYAALTDTGLWNQFEEWVKSQTIDGVNAWTAFSLAQDLSSDHPLFMKYLTAAQSALGIDNETITAILATAEIKE